jgi:predicted MFS family arabinose efflux permease
MLVIPVLHHTGHLSFAALLGTTFAIGVFSAPYFASSRLVLPEVAGEDERAVASVNAVLAGANQLTQIVGPVLAGVLIAASSPSAALVVDGCTYVFSFATIGLVVRAGGRVAAGELSRGVLAGLRFLLGDPLLGPMALAACAINFFAQGIIVGIQGLAYFRYHADAHVLGVLFGGFGVGALLGALLAERLAQRVDLAVLAAAAIVAMPLPLFLLALHLPSAAASVAVAAFGFFTPLVNAPVLGMLTVRTPPELRPKVMTALMTVATLAGPFGFLGAGLVLRHVTLTELFLALPALLTLGGLAFAAVALRQPRAAAHDVAVADVAHG